MKKLVLFIVLILSCQAGYSQQNVNDLFKEFSQYANVDKISLGKISMGFIRLFKHTMGVNGIEVLVLDKCDRDVKQHFTNAIRELKDTSFETVVSSNENGERIKIMARIKKDTIHELVIFISGNDLLMTRIKGKIKKSDIEKLVAQHS
ncbi:MAG: DUF4252 domain-containing protein [Tannerellaceae bacterium]|jgi:hypothetical protein|nr:DUF4252 domain-containing protein [Tannerellaceae bacterium]